MKLNLKTTPVLTSEEMSVSKMGLAQESGDLFSFYLRDKIYSNKILAVVREYISNAIDEHTKYNVDVPVKISFTKEGSEYMWSCRDFANGLSDEGVRNIFGMYGRSTKRECQNSTGMFGIGSKAGHAYTDTFFVTSYHKGTMIKYACVLGGGENGVPIGNIYEIDRGSTEETGLEISLYVKTCDVSEFTGTTSRFVRYLEPQSAVFTCFNDFGDDVIIHPLKPIHTKTINGYTFSSVGGTTQRVKYKMGSTVYRETYSSNIRTLLVDIPIGKMTIPLSREEFEDNKNNQRVLEEIDGLITQIIQEEKSNLPDITFGEYIQMEDSGNIKTDFCTFSSVDVYYSHYTNKKRLTFSDSTYENNAGNWKYKLYMEDDMPVIFQIDVQTKGVYNRWVSRLSLFMGNLANSKKENIQYSFNRFGYTLDPANYSGCKVINVKKMKLPKLETEPKKVKDKDEPIRYAVYKDGNYSSYYSADELEDHVATQVSIELEDGWWKKVQNIDQLNYRTITLRSYIGTRNSRYHRPWTCNTQKMIDLMLAKGWVEYGSLEYNEAKAIIQKNNELERRLEESKRYIQKWIPNHTIPERVVSRIVKTGKNPYDKMIRALTKENSFRGRIINCLENYTYSQKHLTREDFRKLLMMK